MMTNEDLKEMEGISHQKILHADRNAMRLIAEVRELQAKLATVQGEKEKELEEEQGRWQEAIYSLICKTIGDEVHIDGSGCDSGDPLDVTMTEIQQLICTFQDKLDESSSTCDSLKAEVERVKEGRLWLVWSHEHGAWWGPARAGYSTSTQEAGRYTLAEAMKCANTRSISVPPPEVVSPSPELLAALNATAQTPKDGDL